MSKQPVQSMGSRFYKRLRESNTGINIFGTPKTHDEIKHTKVMVLGAVEQSYGIYQVPTFAEQVNILWNDPVVKEAITMFAEQVVATGFFLTSNEDYKLRLGPKRLSALEVIKQWCDDNNIDLKLLEIAIELKAFGNSFWRIDDLGFVKVPIESVWHMVRVETDIPLQERYNVQLVPIYGGKVLPWNQFMHFRVGITGYHAPLGQGVIYSLLAKPVDSQGNVAPSVYDVRLNHRRSLDQGMKNFSFGNVWIGVPNMSNEDFERKDEKTGNTISDDVANMSPTGNRVITNTDVKVALEVPERTQSYDSFIKDQRNEFFMSLADPTLKLGIEEGFTKATSETASEFYKFKISTMRRTIKEHFEDLFKQILDKLGYDGREAGVQINFGPEETAEYAIADIFAAQAQGIISKQRAVYLLSKYHKWDIDVESNDTELKEEEEKANKLALASKGVAGGEKVPKLGQMLSAEAKDVKGAEKAGASESEVKVQPYNPAIIVTELPDSVGGYNADMSKLYLDSELPEEYYALVQAKEEYEFSLKENMIREDRAKEAVITFEHSLARELNIDYNKYYDEMVILAAKIKARNAKGPEDLVRGT